MIVFDPFGWAARVVPEKWLHRLVRAGAVAVFGVFLARRIGQYGDFLLKPLWAVETLIYLVLASAFLIRLDPIDRARGVRDIAVPLAGGLLPFALLLTPPNAVISTDPVLLHGVFWWMTAASALTIWGIWTLRSSFSITVEARALVTAGPYRWLRHPIYAGELLAATAVMVWRFSPLNLALLVLFIAVQLLRSHWEEEKLSKVFPAYRDWAGTRLWFWRFRSAAPARSRSSP